MIRKRIKPLLFLLLILLAACSGKKQNTINGFETLKWGSDIPTVKQYLEKNINADYDYYEMESATGKLKLRFKGSEFLSLPVSNWVFEILKGGLTGYQITISDSKNIKQDFTKLINYYKEKLGKPTSLDSVKVFWNIRPDESKTSEKVSVRKFNNAITIKVEKVNG